MSDNVNLRQMSYQEIKGYVSKLKARVEKLEDEVAFLDCLRAAGVDNWSGYGDAQEMMDDDE